ncbi:MAG: YqgE/AlgH family protein [Gammaproteobacteria bacterium]
MPDSRFQETVILILEHENMRGTLGLVLNRPTDITLVDVLPESPYQDASLALDWGGPVGRENLFMLLRTDQLPEESEPVFADIVWSASAKVLANTLAEPVNDATLRVCLGIASWAPGQLDKELSRGGWKLFQAQIGAVFNDLAPVELWRHFIDAPTQILAQTGIAPDSGYR